MNKQIDMAIKIAEYYKNEGVIEKIEPYFKILRDQLLKSIEKVYGEKVKITYRGEPFFFHMAHCISVTYHVTVYIISRDKNKITELEQDFTKSLEKYRAHLNFDKFHMSKQHYNMSINLLL